MNFLELVNKRKSIRSYTHEPVDRALIAQCMEAVRLAPSACNSQPWKFIAIDDPELLPEIKKATSSMGMNKWIHDVPVIIAVVMERGNFTSQLGGFIKQKDYANYDIGIAVEHFCLQAAELDLGTCIIGWFDEKKVKKLLGTGKQIPLLIAVGHPEKTPESRPRKSMNDIFSWNK